MAVTSSLPASDAAPHAPAQPPVNTQAGIVKAVGKSLDYLFLCYAVVLANDGFVAWPNAIRNFNNPAPVALMAIDISYSDPYARTANSILLAGIGVLFLIHPRKMFSMIWGGRLVSVFILWAIATNFWTDDLAVSFRRTILVYLSLSVTWYMLETYTVDTLIRMFARVMLFLMLCSAFVSTFLPSLGHVLKDYPGAWTGIFSHKNTLGSLCQLAVLGEGYLIQADRKHRVWRALIIAFYLFVAVMCQSKTGLITSILTLAFYVFLRLLLLPGMLRVWATYLIAAGSTIGGLLVFFNFTAIMTAIGRDPTLSGRIQVWESLIRVTRHPFAGYGYAAFWSSKNPDVGRVWADVGWPVPEAHDAYLDLFLNVGLVGLIITMVTFWLSFRILLRMHLEGKYEWTSYFLAYLTSYFFSNIVETKMYFPFDMTTLLFILAYFATLKFGMVPNTHPALIRRGARVFGGMKQRSRLDQRPAIDLLDPPPGKVPA